MAPEDVRNGGMVPLCGLWEGSGFDLKYSERALKGFQLRVTFLFNFQHWKQQAVQEAHDSDLGLDLVLIVHDNRRGDKWMDRR